MNKIKTSDQRSGVAELIKKHLDTIKQQHSELGSQLKDFKVEKELGQGSFGTVYLVTPLSLTTTQSKITPIKCVMKKISLN